MQLLNAYRCIAVILSGIFILFSDVQPEKAPYAIPRSAILSGITSVSNEEQPENDKLSISFTSPLKLTFFRLSQFVKENCFIVLGSCMLSNEIQWSKHLLNIYSIPSETTISFTIRLKHLLYGKILLKELQLSLTGSLSLQLLPIYLYIHRFHMCTQTTNVHLNSFAKI